MKRFFIFTIVALVAVFQTVKANDGVYFVSGSHLVPLQETDISIKKEVLSITLCDDGYASVDVKYEMVNNGKDKTVTMGFEANVPYNDGEPFNKSCKHPFIKDFSATMNGQVMPYKNGVAKEIDDEKTDYTPLDMKKWREPRETDPEYEENGADVVHLLFNPSTKEYIRYAYVYYFTANFKKGVNTIHHTYRYQMSYGVGRTFEVPYWLKPAMRWANHQIDDFTLRVKADNTTKHFLIDGNCFNPEGFKVVSGKGKVRKIGKTEFRDELVEVVLRDGTLEWHSNNFTTTEDMCIKSADDLYPKTKDDYIYYDSSIQYHPFFTMSEECLNYFGTSQVTSAFISRICRNLPYAHRGYVFKDPVLKQIFQSQWWYMPDPQWTPTQNSFNKNELKLIEDNN